jgi:hypothetical protein
MKTKTAWETTAPLKGASEIGISLRKIFVHLGEHTKEVWVLLLAFVQPVESKFFDNVEAIVRGCSIRLRIIELLKVS